MLSIELQDDVGKRPSVVTLTKQEGGVRTLRGVNKMRGLP